MKFLFAIWAAIFMLLAVATRIDLQSETSPGVSEDKISLLFYQTRLNEVNTSRRIGKAFMQKGEKAGKKLLMYDLRYASDTIGHIEAKRAKDSADTIWLEGDVVFIDKSGLHYVTQAARYEKSAQLLIVPVPFTATRGAHLFQGKRMRYEGKGDRLAAWRVFASFKK